MVDFSYEIINQIKGATDDSHVKAIIENSFQKLKAKNSNASSRRFMMNLIMAFRYVKAEGLSPKSLSNVSTAIEVIEKLRKQEYNNLF